MDDGGFGTFFDRSGVFIVKRSNKNDDIIDTKS